MLIIRIINKASAVQVFILVLISAAMLAACQSTRVIDPTTSMNLTPQLTTQTASAAPSLPAPSETPPPSTEIPLPESTGTNIVYGSYYISGVMGHRQYFKLGCEAAAAVYWADYFGFTINEFEFQYRLPLSDNPDLGFVGNVDSPWGQVPPYAYGVHAYPVANLLRQYGLRATGVKGWTLENVKQELAQDQPVIAWVIGNMVGGVPYEYTDQNGYKVTVAAYEHVVLLTGYDENTIRYLNNGRFYDIPNENFLNSWGVLGNMAVFWED